MVCGRPLHGEDANSRLRNAFVCKLAEHLAVDAGREGLGGVARVEFLHEHIVDSALWKLRRGRVWLEEKLLSPEPQALP